MNKHRLSEVVSALLTALSEGQANADRYSETLRQAGSSQQGLPLRIPSATIATARLHLKFAIAELSARATTKKTKGKEPSNTNGPSVIVEAEDLSGFALEQLSSFEFEITMEYDQAFSFKSKNE